MTTSQFLDAAQRLGEHNGEIQRLLSEIRGALTNAKTKGVDALEQALAPLDQLDDIVRGQLKAYVFHTGAADSVLAAGAGRDLEEARLDAMVRMRSRAIAASKDGLFLISHLPKPYQDMYMALANRAVTSKYSKPLEQASDLVTTWADGYFSVETALVSVTVQTDRALLDRIVQYLPLSGRESLVHAPTFTVMRAVREHGLRNILDKELDVHMIDWREVAMDIDRDLLGLDESQAMQDKAPGLGAAVQTPAGRQVDDSTQAAAPVKLREIPAHVQEVLRECTVNADGVLQLPRRQLEADLYQSVKKVLTEAEAKWSKKSDGFVFKLNNAQAVLNGLAGEGKFLAVKDLGFFPTPNHLVDKMIERAQLEAGMSVMEPSAGRGAIARRAADVVGIDNVMTIELYEENAKILRDQGFRDVLVADFLKIEPEPTQDVVLMNPPFTRGIDVAHVMHAARFLKPDGRLVAIMSTGWEGNKSKAAANFRDFVSEVEGQVVSIPAGQFKEAGTDVPTTLVVMDAQNFPWNREVIRPTLPADRSPN